MAANVNVILLLIKVRESKCNVTEIALNEVFSDVVGKGAWVILNNTYVMNTSRANL